MPVRDPVYGRYWKSSFQTLYAFITVTAKRVYLIPVEVPVLSTVDRVCYICGGTSAGNVRVGIYGSVGDSPQGAPLKAQSQSYPKPGASRTCEIITGPVQLPKGLYWAAWVSDESTTQLPVPYAEEITGGTLQQYYYTLASYGPLTDPCPAVTGGASTQRGSLFKLRVSNVP